MIEGIDAVGKTTLVESLAKRFRDADMAVMTMSFPRYDGPLGKTIRHWLDGKNLEHPYAFQALMAADKHEVAERMRSVMVQGQIVICSRYWQSAVTYGGTSAIPMQVTWEMHSGLPIPSLNVLLDMPVLDALARRPDKRDAYEKNPDFLLGVRRKYLDLWEQHPAGTGNWAIVDASQTEAKVLDEVHGKLKILYGL